MAERVLQGAIGDVFEQIVLVTHVTVERHRRHSQLGANTAEIDLRWKTGRAKPASGDLDDPLK